MSDPEDELARRIARTLDRSLDRLDPAVLDSLHAARRAAQAAPAHRRRWMAASFAAAAGLAALAIVPWLLREPALAPAPPQVVMYLDVDPGLLENLELLEAIGDEPDAG